jgi:hypothetical protein
MKLGCGDVDWIHVAQNRYSADTSENDDEVSYSKNDRKFMEHARE